MLTLCYVFSMSTVVDVVVFHQIDRLCIFAQNFLIGIMFFEIFIPYKYSYLRNVGILSIKIYNSSVKEQFDSFFE